MKKSIFATVLFGLLSQNTLSADSCSYSGYNHYVLSSSFYNIGFTVCSTHFPEGSDARAAIDFALSRLNRVQGNGLHFYIKGTTSHKDYYETMEDDGINSIDVTEEGCDDYGDCDFSSRADTKLNSLGNIDEFDIAVNEEISWNYGMPYSWTENITYYLRATLLHEIGHGLGFYHGSSTIDDLSIMGNRVGEWIGNKDIDIKAFDNGHIRYHYGDTSNGLPDLVLSNYDFVYDSSEGKYFAEANEGISDTSLSRGSSFTLSWTRMNTGPKAITTDYLTGVYLSTDETLSSDDTLIKTVPMTTSVPANSTYYIDTTVTIPTTSRTGNFFVIVKLDKDNVISEQYENNNSITMHDQITIK